MYEFFPLIAAGAVIGALSVIFLVAFITVKDKKTEMGFERTMKDSEITRRLLAYTRPHLGSFAIVLGLMFFSIAYDVISPMLIGNIEEMVKEKFEMSELFAYVALYAGILIVSLVCTYFEALILQKTGQKILTTLREDVFTHI